ncbi:MAG: Rieske 2Fe-2S domain-containing protein, partial [Myxococcota bacterium]|nr:Rieske 2Fe-2S domain-containing protein [Myxococcota bacterium]
MGIRSFLKQRIRERIPGGETGSASDVGVSGSATRGRLPTELDADGFRAVAFENQVGEGAGRTVDLAGHNVAVFRVGGRLYAIDDACTHEDGPLAEGDLE